LFMKCLYRVRPYELEVGSANALYKKWRGICTEFLTGKKTGYSYSKICKEIVREFDNLPIDESLKKPRVGIVGEILVKYMPLANNHIVELLEKEGAEVLVPDFMNFLAYCIYNEKYKAKFLGAAKLKSAVSGIIVKAMDKLRKPAFEALEKSRRFEPSLPIDKIAELAKPFLSIGNQHGEGWFLTGEMADLLTNNVPNIVCIQPFACLPNHIVGKGVIKALKKAYPFANIAAVDYDPGASEVNQLNRIKLMLSAAKKKILDESKVSKPVIEGEMALS